MNAETRMKELEMAAQAFAEARAALSAIVSDLEAEMNAVKRRKISSLRRAVAKSNDRQSDLKNLIEASKELFEKPRTRVFHGIKVGYQKGKGGLDIGDEERVLKLILKHFPDREEELIRTKKAPDKTALGKLPVSDLKRLGIEVIATQDEIVLKATDSAVDKIVDALLKGMEEDSREAA